MCYIKKLSLNGWDTYNLTGEDNGGIGQTGFREQRRWANETTHSLVAEAPWECQWGKYAADEMMHTLVEEQNHRRISRVDFWEETKWHTAWWWNSTTEGSAGLISRRRQDNTLPGGGTAPWKGQQGGFQEGDKTTHELVAEQHHRRVSRVDFEEETRQHTAWWQNSAAEGSAG